MASRHIIDLTQISPGDLKDILELARTIRLNPKQFYGSCDGKILATLFYEPSTRTQMSFQTAMLRLGGRVIGFDNPLNSSVSKGESLMDTIKIINSYADIIALRHPLEGSAKAASFYSENPLINAGDGGHLHPTQTLTDLVTLTEEKGTVSGMTIGVCGDLKHGRTVHSLINAMCRFDNNFVFISTPELDVPQYIKDELTAFGRKFTFIPSLEEAIPALDVLYMTRIQRERFASLEEYDKQKNVYRLDAAKLKYAKKDLRILHPLPRVDEIAVEVDDDPRAVYFKQAAYGVFARMALIIYLLENSNGSKTVLAPPAEHRCKNPKCISNSELYLPASFKKVGDTLVCDYCDFDA